ncbi:cupredoxin domain-containing protein [Streptacidiphilus sp. PAMC 29251]
MLLALPLAACSSSTKSAVSAPSAATSAAATSAAATASAPADASAPQIMIDNFKFSPATLTVKPGQKVTVVNKDSTTHTVTATAGKAFDTGDIASGASGSFTAPSAPGSYPYDCTIHQFMHGTLTVK